MYVVVPPIICKEEKISDIWPTGCHVTYCYHFASVVCPLLYVFHILIICSGTTGSIENQLCRNDVCEVLYKNFSFHLDPTKTISQLILAIHTWTYVVLIG